MKKRISLMLFVITLLSCLALSAGAEDIQGFEQVLVNPEYADIFEEQTSEVRRLNKDELDALIQEINPDDVEYCYTYEDAAEVLRKGMAERQPSITVGYAAANADKQSIYDIKDEAFKHTGVPNEGDYIERHYKNITLSYITQIKNNITYLAIEYAPTYYTTAEQEAEVDAAIDEVLAELNITGKSEYEKISAIYDYICDNVTYDYTNLNDETYYLKYTTYAALINKTAVCQGYATLFYRLALESGVDARYIRGMAGEENDLGRHGWNIAQIGSYYYNLDTTWDAGRDPYGYFLKCEANFPKHYRNDNFNTDEFNTAYPMSPVDYDPATGSERNIIASGTCGKYGDNLTWALDDTGLMTIDGTGEMANWVYNTDGMDHGAVFEVEIVDRPWNDYSDNILSVIISDGVTSIGDLAFAMCGYLTEINIPESITSINRGAFEGCYKLTGINIPESVTSIGKEAFQHCHSLTGINIHSLTGINIPESVTSIGDGAFFCCYRLTEINIPESVTSIGDGAFADCDSLTEIHISESVTSIGYGAFRNCDSLTEINILGSEKSIGDYAFADCASLTEINISLSEISNYAFAGCGLTEINIPESVTSINEGAFYCCENLTEVHFPESITIIGNSVFEGCINLTEVYFSESITTIGKGAFKGCINLTEVHFHDSITTIGDSAFEGCINLTEVHFPESITTIGKGAFNECDNITSAYFYGDAPELVYYYFYSRKDGTVWQHFSFGIPRDNFTVYYIEGKSGWTTPIWPVDTGDLRIDYDPAFAYPTATFDPSKPITPGDINTDEELNGKDITLLRRYISGGFDMSSFYRPNADLNSDGIINPKDVTLLRRKITSPAEDTTVTLKGVLQNDKTGIQMFEWDMESGETWRSTRKFNNINIVSSTQVSDTKAYAVDCDNNTMLRLDLSAGTVEELGNLAAPMSDLTYCRLASPENPLLHGIYYYYLIPAKNPVDTENFTRAVFDFQTALSEYTGAVEFVGIASAGMTIVAKDDGTIVEAEVIYMLDSAGYIWVLNMYPDNDGYSCKYAIYSTSLFEAGYLYVLDENQNPLSSLVMGQDGNLYFSGYNGEKSVIFRLTFNTETNKFDAEAIAFTDPGVYPAALYSAESNTPADITNAAADITAVTGEVIESTAITAEDLRNIK